MNILRPSVHVLLVLILSATFLHSCIPAEPEISPENGSIQFAAAEKSITGGRVKGNAAAMVVSIKGSDGNVIHDKKRLDILKFGNEYISSPLELKTGNYTLTEFFIVDENNQTISATPLEGSDLAYLVNDPAPVSFTVTKDNVSKVSPEVVAVENNTAADFGYVAFSLNEVATLSFSIGVYLYNQQSGNLELTSARLTVTAGSAALFNKDVENITNTVRVKDGFTSYHLRVTKTGYIAYEKDFTAAELKAFTVSAALTVVLFPESLTDGLVAWYPFNGNAQDASGNNLHGTNNGATLVAGKSGATNSAYQFNGTTYINVPSAPLKLNVYTYSMWVNASTLPAYGEVGITFSIGDDVTTRHQALSLGNHYATAEATGWSAGGWNDGPEPYHATGISTNILPPINQWFHLVMVRSQSTVTMYLNNQVIGTIATGGYLPFYGTATTANIGIRCNYTQGFKGKVDNFRIYNRVLSASEIGSLFNE